MSTKVNPIPEGHHTLTASLNLRGAARAVEFYKAAFGAVERFLMPTPDGSGRIMHGEIQIGDSIVMLCDETPEWGAVSPESVGGCPLSLNLYVEDCDSFHARAVAAGAEVLRPPTTYPWGERSSMVRDPFGYRWAICTQVEEVSPEEVMRRLAAG
ncbi:MAG: VOC family protein [Candidatus Methylacidiphilales bacterium]|nr:VOC family protein [Candidatus Methylacidiphilales bacterium]